MPLSHSDVDGCARIQRRARASVIHKVSEEPSDHALIGTRPAHSTNPTSGPRGEERRVSLVKSSQEHFIFKKLKSLRPGSTFATVLVYEAALWAITSLKERTSY